MESDAGSDSSVAALSANEADPLYVPLNRFAFRRDVRVYAVMDGAMFDDLPGLLKSKNLSARSLYRDGTDEDWVESGPWLVDPYRLADGRDEEDDEEDDGYGAAVLPDNDVEKGDRELSDEEMEDQADLLASRMKAALDAGDETGAGLLPPDNPDPDDSRPFAKPVYPWPQIRALIEIADGSPGLVFWIGDEGVSEPQLHRHLRTINKVLIPAGYGDDNALSGSKTASGAGSNARSDNAFEGGAAADTHEAVQFRHADGNVLAEVMPVLDEAQFSRLFGPARQLVFTAPDHPADDGSVLYEAPLPDDASPPHAGLLRLSMEQMKGVEAARLERLKGRLGKHLRKVTGGKLDGTNDRAIRQHVEKSLDSGSDFGFQTEASWRRWTHLMYVTRGEVATAPSVQGYMRQKGADPDLKVKQIMASTIDALRKRTA